MKRLGILSLATLALGAVALVGCSQSSSPALDAILESDATSQDEPPSQEVYGELIDEGAYRLVGEDSKDITYYVGKGVEGDTCLLVYPPDDQWVGGCGDPGAFSVSGSGVVAWLVEEQLEGMVPDEDVLGIVYVKNGGY